MNERIRELLLKAGFTNAYTDPKEGFELVFVDEEHTTKSVAKFAELIVRDCRDMFVVGSVSWNLLNEKLEHFGVEE